MGGGGQDSPTPTQELIYQFQELTIDNDHLQNEVKKLRTAFADQSTMAASVATHSQEILNLRKALLLSESDKEALKSEMERLQQENRKLREQVTELQTKVDRLTRISQSLVHGIKKDRMERRTQVILSGLCRAVNTAVAARVFASTRARSDSNWGRNRFRFTANELFYMERKGELADVEKKAFAEVKGKIARVVGTERDLKFLLRDLSKGRLSFAHVSTKDAALSVEELRTVAADIEDTHTREDVLQLIQLAEETAGTQPLLCLS